MVTGDDDEVIWYAKAWLGSHEARHINIYFEPPNVPVRARTYAHTEYKYGEEQRAAHTRITEKFQVVEVVAVESTWNGNNLPSIIF